MHHLRVILRVIEGVASSIYLYKDVAANNVGNENVISAFSCPIVSAIQPSYSVEPGSCVVLRRWMTCWGKLVSAQAAYKNWVPTTKSEHRQRLASSYSRWFLFLTAHAPASSRITGDALPIQARVVSFIFYHTVHWVRMRTRSVDIQFWPRETYWCRFNRLSSTIMSREEPMPLNLPSRANFWRVWTFPFIRTPSWWSATSLRISKWQSITMSWINICTFSPPAPIWTMLNRRSIALRSRTTGSIMLG